MDDPDDDETQSERINEILENAENMLKMACWGLIQYDESDGEQKMVGLRNTVVFGRSVTFALQKLRGKVEGDFDDWYDERIEVLKEDDVLSHMHDLRNKILKEGSADVDTYAHVTLNTAQLREWAPNWADSIFIGDEYGGSGWTVESADGREQKFYAEIPEHIDADVGLKFSTEEGEDIDKPEVRSAEEDLAYYVKVLSQIVQDARKEFATLE